MMKLRKLFKSKTIRLSYLILLMMLFAGAYVYQTVTAQPQTTTQSIQKPEHFIPFSLFTDPKYSQLEIYCLLAVLGIAIAGLLYALLLVRQIKNTDRGTEKMQEVPQQSEKERMPI